MTEDQIQAECVLWFSQNYPKDRGMLFAVPNGRERSWRDAVMLKATGVIPGVADLCLVTYGGNTLWLECKTPWGQQSADQVSWQKKVEDRGHFYYIFKSLDEFKAIIWQTIGK